MANRIILALAAIVAIASMYFAYSQYTKHIAISIESNQLTFKIPKQIHFSSTRRLILTSNTGENYVVWDYIPNGDVDFTKLELPRKIVLWENPFSYKPLKEEKHELKSGNYSFGVVVGTYDSNDLDTAKGIDMEKVIDTDFCINVNKEKVITFCN